MSGPLTILDDETATKRAAAVRVYEFTYDTHLAAGVELASVGTFTLFPDDEHISKDNPTLVTGNRKVRVRISGGKPHKEYTVDHTAVTNESPTQTVAAKFTLFVTP
jgi:hypothetical protein